MACDTAVLILYNLPRKNKASKNEKKANVYCRRETQGKRRF
jgi:hypothetical protein